MNVRQKILAWLYPLFMRAGKASPQEHRVVVNRTGAVPPIPFYSLHARLNNGQPLDFSTLKGKKVLLVNTASNCGYTAQYGELETLYERFKDRLVILGFPANDFKEQEKGSDAEIAAFCKVNYGVSFPIMSKSTVIKGEGQHEVYRWLTDAAKNGWNAQQPAWNFCKYLVDDQGVLKNYFAMTVSPLSPDVISAVESNS